MAQCRYLPRTRVSKQGRLSQRAVTSARSKARLRSDALANVRLVERNASPTSSTPGTTETGEVRRNFHHRRRRGQGHSQSGHVFRDTACQRILSFFAG